MMVVEKVDFGKKITAAPRTSWEIFRTWNSDNSMSEINRSGNRNVMLKCSIGGTLHDLIGKKLMILLLIF